MIRVCTMAATFTVMLAAACGSTTPDASVTTDAGVTSNGADAADNPPGQLASNGDAGGAACEPPDLLVVLDRTDSMSATPNGGKPDDTPAGRATTKWALALGALDVLVAAPRDATIRFGLELFPQNPEADGGAGECQTLSSLLEGNKSTNPKCQAGQIVLAPGTSQGAAIAASVSQDDTPLCVSTPIGGAMQTAADALAAIAVPGRDQYVLLVTDGAETCDVDALPIVQALAAKNVKTFVVGFGQDGDAGDKGVRVPYLNDLACAGQTAQSFASSCVKDPDGGSGYVAGADPSPVFFAAQDQASLGTALDAISKQICCGCPR